MDRFVKAEDVKNTIKEYLKTFKDEEAYKEEGYKVKILTPDNSIKDDTVVKESISGRGS